MTSPRSSSVGPSLIAGDLGDKSSASSLHENLPENLKGALPTVEEIEQDLQQLQEKPDE